MVDLQGRYSGCQVDGDDRIGVACEQALHLGDIVKSGRARGTREETPRPSQLRRSLARFASLAQIEEFDRRPQWGQKSAAKTSLVVLYSQNCTAGIRRHHHRLF